MSDQPPDTAEDSGWSGWLPDLPSYSDVSQAVKTGVAEGVGYSLFGASTMALAGGAPTPDEVRAADEAAKNNPDYCDRTTIFGRIGGCEAQKAFDTYAGVVGNLAPTLNLVAGAAAIGVGTVAVLALANQLGLTPVFQAGGRAVAGGIRATSRAVLGGR